jgi:hypothetical protein
MIAFSELDFPDFSSQNSEAFIFPVASYAIERLNAALYLFQLYKWKDQKWLFLPGHPWIYITLYDPSKSD